MAQDVILAQGWTFEVDDGGGYDEIGGITKFSLGYDDSRTDATEFVDEGNKAHRVVARGKTIQVDGHMHEDPDTGARDTGQASIEALCLLIGLDAMANLRVTSPGGTAKVYYGSFSLGGGDAGNEDLTPWGFEFTRSGADVS